MKLILVLVPLSLLVLTFLTGAANSTSAPPPVLDTSGKILRAGANYYILPAVHGPGGGLTLASTGNNTCPLHVVQEQNPRDNGVSLTFSPVNAKKGVVRVATDLNIKFSATTVCRHQSTVWKVGKQVVTTGGVEGHPGRETLSSWFKIEAFGANYKLVFCPNVCKECKIVCKDLGVFVDKKGIRVLALSDVPLKVVFKKF